MKQLNIKSFGSFVMPVRRIDTLVCAWAILVSAKRWPLLTTQIGNTSIISKIPIMGEFRPGRMQKSCDALTPWSTRPLAL